MHELTPEFIALQAALAGEYSLQRELGRGGMGVVFLARDVHLDRHVAIKVLPGHLAAAPLARERFLREARTAAGLSHPNIVPIHRVSEAAGHVYFVMAYVPGETLGERIRRAGPLPANEAMRIMREVAWALAYAHRHGVVHRDVKPDNVLLEEGSGRAMVTDFGIAHLESGSLDGDSGRIIGTAHFMSPEQALNEPVDGRSDLYALGVVGYVATSGQLPFEASSVPALLLQQVSAAPRAIAALVPGLPRVLASAIDRCLAKNPGERFANGEALADALAPSGDGRAALPAPLRAWLAERNPAATIYAVWSGVIGIPFFFDATQYLMHHRAEHLLSMVQLLIVGAAPLLPMLGFHANRAQRMFRAGYTLADLRGALDVADREQHEGELAPDMLARTESRQIRVGAGISFTVAMILTFFSDALRLPLELHHVLVPFHAWQVASLSSWLVTAGMLLAASMTQTRLMPVWMSRALKGGLRDRLWRSRLGEWAARRLGSGASAGRHPAIGMYQPTEAVLGLAASDLFAALPVAYREQLAELPAIVAALEGRAAEARAQVEALDARGAGEAGRVMPPSRAAASERLGATVAALESIRIDLLRLHAGAADLGPLTTLLDDARELGAQVARLAEAQREVARPFAERREATPV